MTTLSLSPQITAWLNRELEKQGITRYRVSEVMADADARRYYRLAHSGGSKILMHILAEPRDRVSQVLTTTKLFAAADFRVPTVEAYSQSLGLILQEDFGKTSLWHIAHAIDAEGSDCPKTDMPQRASCYEMFVREILRIQRLDTLALPSMEIQYLVSEMQIFSDWLLGEWLGQPDAKDQKMLQEYYLYLAESLFSAPQVCVHRDFHSQNLFIVRHHNPTDRQNRLGILDYQGAMIGHFCYDLASLLYDAYVQLSGAEIESLFALFCEGVSPRFNLNAEDIVQQLNLVIIQRFLKICGQFVRLSKQEQKDRYMAFLLTAAERVETALAGPLPNASEHSAFFNFWRLKVQGPLNSKIL